MRFSLNACTIDSAEPFPMRARRTCLPFLEKRQIDALRFETRSPAVAGMADSWRQINLVGGQGHGIRLVVRSVQWQA